VTFIAVPTRPHRAPMKSAHIICFVIFLFLAPYALCSVLVFAAARKCLQIYLAGKHGPKFKGFVEGQDVVWSIGGSSAKGIINVMAYIVVDKAAYEPVRTSMVVMMNLRKRFKTALLGARKVFPKLFYQKLYKWGYYYWFQDDVGTIEKYVGYLDFGNEAEFITQEDLRRTVSRTANSGLPDRNTRNWELLVGNKPIDAQTKVKFPILFRVSHSLGDGVALLRIFLEIVSDSPKTTDTMWTGSSEAKPYENMSIVRMAMCLTVVYVKKILGWVEHIAVLGFMTPYKLADIGFLKVKDKNSLHPKKLNGEKMVYWIHESDMKLPLLQIMKEIRRKFPETRFNDILATLLSRGLESYYKYKAEKPPSQMTVITPERLRFDETSVELKNNFSVAMQTLPIEDPLVTSNLSKASRFCYLLQKVKAHAANIQEDYEHFINFYILEYVPTYFPKYFVSKMFACDHSTLAISALPGPNRKFKISGHELQDITYWVPNIGLVGICVSLFSYDNKLQLGILADRAAIKTESDLSLILKGMVKEIKELKDTLNIKVEKSS